MVALFNDMKALLIASELLASQPLTTVKID